MRCGINVCYSCGRCVCESCAGGEEIEEELYTCSYCGPLSYEEEGLLDSYDDEEEDE